MKSRFALLVVATFVTSLAIAASYYEAIQEGLANPLPAKQFRQLEKAATKNFANADQYYGLARRFGDTTEKVWAIIYGEVFCNLTQDETLQAEMGRQVFEWFSDSIKFNGGKMTVDLTHHAQLSSSGGPPFETSFELSIVFGALGNSELDPLTIAGLAKLRRKQLAIWKQRQLPVTQVTNWQQSITAASHYEAYNYWLFRHARRTEFDAWVLEHQTEYEAWLEWRSKNVMQLASPDFHRVRLAG